MTAGIIPASWSGPLQSVLRIMAGLLFLSHGTAKLFGFPHVAAFDGVNLFSLLGVAGVLETTGGALIALGLFTRIAAFVLSGEMAVAYFMIHAPHSIYPLINQGELAIMYSFVFLYLAAAGPGPWSFDARNT